MSSSELEDLGVERPLFQLDVVALALELEMEMAAGLEDEAQLDHASAPGEERAPLVVELDRPRAVGGGGDLGAIPGPAMPALGNDDPVLDLERLVQGLLLRRDGDLDLLLGLGRELEGSRPDLVVQQPTVEVVEELGRELEVEAADADPAGPRAERTRRAGA